MINLLRRVALAAVLLAAGLVPVSAQALAAPPVPLAGMTVIEVPPLPWEDQDGPKKYTQVPTAEREAAKKATSTRAADEVTKGHPPMPPAVNAAAAKMVTCVPICRHYARMLENADADPANGLSTTITIGKPFTQSGANHSLGEVAVQSADQGDIVEVMWRVNTVARPDGNPILEAYHWIDGVPQGYRTGFVDYASNPINLGAGLPKPANRLFYIGSTGTDWWVGYDTNWVASLPKSRFGVDEFALSSDQVQIGQAFYEVAADGAGEEHPCDDMGTGWDSDPPVSGTGSLIDFAWTGSATAVDVTVGIVTNPGGITGDTHAYHAVKINNDTMRGSGPAWNAAGTAAGTKDAC